MQDKGAHRPDWVRSEVSVRQWITLVRAAARGRQWLKLLQQEEQACNRVEARETFRSIATGADSEQQLNTGWWKPEKIVMQNLKDKQVIGNDSLDVVFKATMDGHREVVTQCKLASARAFQSLCIYSTVGTTKYLLSPPPYVSFTAPCEHHNKPTPFRIATKSSPIATPLQHIVTQLQLIVATSNAPS